MWEAFRASHDIPHALCTGARVFHAAIASAPLARTRVATVSHLGQNTCQPEADIEGWSSLGLEPQKGQGFRSVISHFPTQFGTA